MNTSVLRRTAAEILAAALFELFPDVKLLGGDGTDTGFFYDFYFPHPINPETISMIEERMRQVVREKRVIRTLEMVPFSARELLKREGHLRRIDDLPGDGLVEVIQIGSFHDLSSGPHLKNTAELAAFKLFPIERMEGKEIRIRGCAAPSKPDLKDFLKKLDAYEEGNHLQVGMGLRLWAKLGDSVVWKERGIQMREKVADFLKKSLFVGAQEISGPQGIDRTELHADFARSVGGFPMQVGEVTAQVNDFWNPDLGLLQYPEETQVRVTCLTDSEQELISSLQLIRKTLNILGFKFSVRLMGRKRSKPLQSALEMAGMGAEMEVSEGRAPRIDFEVEDELGRSWTVAALEMISVKELPAFSFFIFMPVEKICALLVERCLATEGKLPFWLPENK